MPTDAYSGSDLQVGEIRAVRTFRVGPGGVLFPLFSNGPWVEGTNEARCRIIAADDPVEVEHVAPEPGCSCGFYAYADDGGAEEYPNARHVLAVVACWGHVVAGTRGLRTQFARIEAIWMSEVVPAALAGQVAARYPSVERYTDRARMLVEHPPTMLDCYEIDTLRERRVKRCALLGAVTAGLGLGLVPVSWLGQNLNLRWLWVATVAFFAVGFLILHRRRTDPRARRLSVGFATMVLWLVSPYAGAATALLLRIPLLQITAITIFQRRVLAREAARFPAVIGDSS